MVKAEADVVKRDRPGEWALYEAVFSSETDRRRGANRIAMLALADGPRQPLADAPKWTPAESAALVAVGPRCPLDCMALAVSEPRVESIVRYFRQHMDQLPVGSRARLWYRLWRLVSFCKSIPQDC